MDNMEEKISKNEGHIEDYPIPFHPFIRMFNLENHSNEWVLSSYLNEYKYDKSLSKKLILPDDHQDLIDILVNDSDVILEDIVQGKTGGTTILCRGPAGLGKTLTAQVYSETIGKPIYEVNAGQLGLNPDNIESNLEKILNRAEKWGAITVINEADVFIKKRGDTLIDNAIVASFLNQIERYRGIIFFTTNRMDIDDAVISRCEAVITYKYPDQKKQHLIWRVLADNYNVEVSDKVISQITAKYEKLSGRDIKELLKLANKFISQRNEIFSLELIRKCAMFRDIGTIEK
jgi:SpoVK/Ycf46/Vps4 family AAA+-type ATPase